jgi:hypothetical protein
MDDYKISVDKFNPAKENPEAYIDEKMLMFDSVSELYFS